jgi:hypothetical protein
MFLCGKIQCFHFSSTQNNTSQTEDYFPIYISLSFCQAQPNPQLSWAELALFSFSTAARPPGKNNSEKA